MRMSKKNGMRILFLFWLLMMFGLIYMLNNGKFSIEWIDDTDEKSGYAEPMPRINIEDNRLWGFKKVEKL